MTDPHETMTRIGQGMALGHQGERQAARSLLAAVWEDIGGKSGDPLHRCALAHAMADVQDDVREEIAWDIRALEAADLITDERAAAAGLASAVTALYPSLHLNLGEGYRKLGDLQRATEHMRRGLAAAELLADDGYGEMVKDGLARLAERLSVA